VTALFLLGAAAFAAAYCQAPLYYSNQNQYFLHGLARAGVGLLGEDWLANTLDPTPVFSALVAFTARHLHPWAFHLYYALLFGVYGAAMLGLFASLVGKEVAAARWPVFVALFLAAHAALPRWCSYRWLGYDYPWFLQSGLAGQYLLGAVFQPSAFGALLVAALCLFARGRPFLAAACCGAAATVHPTYLLSAGLLTLGFLAGLLREGAWRRALALGAWSLALVLPVLAYTAAVFGPTSPEAFAEAQSLLVNFRIPHHSRPDRWWDAVAAAQVGWVVLALLLCRGTRLLTALGVPFLAAALLTLAQVATGSDTLALLFPWRVSAVLVPVATAVVLSRLAALPLPLPRVAADVGSALVVLGLVAGGVWVSATRQAFYTAEEERGVVDFVRASREPGEVYFVPVAVLKSTARGSLSTDFKPLRDKRLSDQVVPVDLQGFRLAAGVPIYVDFKSIPYKDVEVLEWHARLEKAQAVQKQLREGPLPEALAELRRLGVSHLIVPARLKPSDEALGRAVYDDDYYAVYRLPSRAGGRSHSRSRRSQGVAAGRAAAYPALR
jgi:hypothetical protein